MSERNELSVEEIRKCRDAFCECASAFRQEATRLMESMAETFHIDLQTLEGIGELKYKKSNKQRGRLNDEWNYFLHGAECRFDNVRTGQIVEIIITTFPEFGVLDGYFFYGYMATTDEFKSLAAKLGDNYLNVYTAIKLFAEEGSLATFEHCGSTMVVAQ